MQNNYQSHQQSRRGLPQIICGAICSLVGVICLIGGIINNNSLESQLSSMFNSKAVKPGTIFIIIGSILLAIGVIILIIGIYQFTQNKSFNSIQTINTPFDYDLALSRANELREKGLISDEEYNSKLVQLKKRVNYKSQYATKESESKYCSHCGAELSLNCKFCKNCGMELEN